MAKLNQIAQIIRDLKDLGFIKEKDSIESEYNEEKNEVAISINFGFYEIAYKKRRKAIATLLQKELKEDFKTGEDFLNEPKCYISLD